MPDPKSMPTLSQEELKDVLSYSPDTGVFVWTKALKEYKNGSIAGFSHNAGYINIHISGITYLAHRLAWLYTHGYFAEYQIDHINGIRNDNRIINLREASASCNIINSKVYSTNKSGVKGVHFNKNLHKFVSVLIENNKRHFLGTFNEFSDAVMARWSAEQKYYKNNCCTNSSAYNHLVGQGIISES